MGYFAISSKRDTDAAPLESRVLIADGDIDRITIAYAQLYFPQGIVEQEFVPGVPEVPAVPPTDEVLDADGNVVTPATPGSPAIPAVPEMPEVRRPPTGQEVFDAVANGLLQGILANTINVEKTNAAQKAQEDIPPIPVAPGAA